MENQQGVAPAYTFACPDCGGAVQDPGDQPTTTCPYCHNIIPVPEEIRQALQERQTQKSLSRWTKYLVIFLIIVFVVPTCLGLVAGLVGILAPLLSIILAFLFNQ